MVHEPRPLHSVAAIRVQLAKVLMPKQRNRQSLCSATVLIVTCRRLRSRSALPCIYDIVYSYAPFYRRLEFCKLLFKMVCAEF